MTPKLLESVVDRLRFHSRALPEKIFLHQETSISASSITYRQAWEDVSILAARIHRTTPMGGVVLIFASQGWLGIAHFLGAMAAGTVPSFMPLPSIKQDPESYWLSHQALIERIHPMTIIVEPSQAVAFAGSLRLPLGINVILAENPAAGAALEIPPPLELDAPALLQHSSGTTGLKKGVMLSHRAIVTQAHAYACTINASESDVIVSWLPVYHDMGLIACLMLPLIYGQTIVLLDPLQWVIKPASLFEAIAKHLGTLCWMPNFAFDHLVQVVRPNLGTMALHSIRAFINCSEVCHARTLERFVSAFEGLGADRSKLHVCYAMAETTFAVTQTPPGHAAYSVRVHQALLHATGRVTALSGPGTVELLSAGAPIPGARVSVRGLDGLHLGEDQAGEIWVESDSLFSGYHNQPDVTSERLAGGWFKTHDRGFLHGGELYVLGRLDDTLIVAGRNVHATEIEALVAEVPGLRAGRAVAFDICNERRGTNDLVVVAERADGESAGDLPARVRQAVFAGIGFYPGRVQIVERGWLRKTTSGKISRHANKEKYMNMLSVGAVAETS